MSRRASGLLIEEMKYRSKTLGPKIERKQGNAGQKSSVADYKRTLVEPPTTTNTASSSTMVEVAKATARINNGGRRGINEDHDRDVLNHNDDSDIEEDDILATEELLEQFKKGKQRAYITTSIKALSYF
ncbi:hypothetical protein LTR70_007105 [Exophiala xenobiotica]|uniref:Uncharacterized protein n=1 Tax=Lithohypha guttulata TaxID=1690604 RepID=A0ABR0K828_9EURO|nr:hypothetical protein LTR24_006302 [Lithohypha guttulata]KAK5314476.1 hypothetical protein LTR70_007105 [Exophiala xenobiotica]